MVHPESGEHWSLDGGEIAGVLEMGPGFPPQVPPHWQVVFMVVDADASGGPGHRARRQGPRPGDGHAHGWSPGGVADPQGAAFAVLSFPASTTESLAADRESNPGG